MTTFEMIEVTALNTHRIVGAVQEAGAELISSKEALENCLKINVRWYRDALV